jgi:molecular chaperone DnaK
MPGMALVEAIPLSIGISIHGGVFDPLIPRNTLIPTQINKFYFTSKNNQTEMTFYVRLYLLLFDPLIQG